jgi:alkaline phosphatase
MKRNLTLIRFLIIYIITSYNVVQAQQGKHVKNVIMMIPDGTSTSVLSLARWYKFGICPEDACWLNIDKYICGLVKTHSSDAPIGDSAPTGSTYATGYLSQTGFIATYPKSAGKDRDLVKIDQTKTYQPLFTILEAAKLDHKSTGLVVTCQFPHATPADFSAHTIYRDQYDNIAKQMVYNHLNLVFGGGTKYLDPAVRNDKENLMSVLKKRNYSVVTDMKSFRELTTKDSLVWGLFAKDALPFDLDSNKDSVPSLAEMTNKALGILSANPNGFFLMVEGSKVDWAAHDNDPVGVATEFLAFDSAVGVAMDFAKKDGNTAVVICPDHGNSAISVGNRRSNHGYDTLSVSSIIQPLKNCKLTAAGLTSILMNKKERSSVSNLFKENTGITLQNNDLDSLMMTINKKETSALTRRIAKIITANTYIGFTTNGHTSEDVMLAVYHPQNYRPEGVIQNKGVNAYMKDILGTRNLDSLTEKYYCPDSVALKGFQWEIIDSMVNGTEIASRKDTSHYGTLIITKSKDSPKRAVIKAYTDYVSIYQGKRELKRILLPSIAVYIYKEDKHNKKKLTFRKFYIPNYLGTGLSKEL